MSSKCFGLRCIRIASAAGKGTLGPAPAGAHSALEIVLIQQRVKFDQGRVRDASTSSYD